MKRMIDPTTIKGGLFLHNVVFRSGQDAFALYMVSIRKEPYERPDEVFGDACPDAYATIKMFDDNGFIVLRVGVPSTEVEYAFIDASAVDDAPSFGAASTNVSTQDLIVVDTVEEI